ncbi:hypothetical protein [Chenggangzhangella methanolivorans]|uniref:Uncharacterized protein n=1 Tax=Chenggangzhangella methanolivorans TaxID=1437009 RepID=A0A9E6R8M6_9HYPH|nr:hypothetical protein [Chenggangzhangella methanolivorans]QZN99516.1 hypothetical protein K6K41_22850 [Chenggangzhangella methanolivorans]
MIRNANSRRDAPHERAELIDAIAAAIGTREIPVSIDGRAYAITLEAYLAHLSNVALVEAGHAASAAALCVTRLVASQDGLGVAGPLGDVDEIAKKILGRAADLVRLEALGLDAAVDAQDLAELPRAAGGDERRGERQAEPDGEAGEEAPVGGGAVAGEDQEAAPGADLNVVLYDRAGLSPRMFSLADFAAMLDRARHYARAAAPLKRGDVLRRSGAGAVAGVDDVLVMVKAADALAKLERQGLNSLGVTERHQLNELARRVAAVRQATP